jgi:hypothetical protein
MMEPLGKANQKSKGKNQKSKMLKPERCTHRERSTLERGIACD